MQRRGRGALQSDRLRNAQTVIDMIVTQISKIGHIKHFRMTGSTSIMRIQTIEDLLIDNIEESQPPSITMDAIVCGKVFQFTQIVRLLRMKMFKSQLDCVDIFWIVWIGILK